MSQGIVLVVAVDATPTTLTLSFVCLSALRAVWLRHANELGGADKCAMRVRCSTALWWYYCSTFLCWLPIETTCSAPSRHVVAVDDHAAGLGYFSVLPEFLIIRILHDTESAQTLLALGCTSRSFFVFTCFDVSYWGVLNFLTLTKPLWKRLWLAAGPPQKFQFLGTWKHTYLQRERSAAIHFSIPSNFFYQHWYRSNVGMDTFKLDEETLPANRRYRRCHR